jgi:hypothetical protein
MRGRGSIGLLLGVVVCVFVPAQAQAAPPAISPIYVVRADHWSPADERDYGQFIAELGESDCATVDQCLHDPHNPFRGSDPPGVEFASDCAQFPYVLRFYFAWKRGLPFSYESDVEPRGAARDLRYDFRGNEVAARVELHSGDGSGYAILEQILQTISSASYRIHPDLEAPFEADFYSVAIRPGAIRPGTVIYDPNGHLATVYAVDPDGRIRYIDAHPDRSVTRGYYDLRFVRAYPGMGAGFKNWRPLTLVGYSKAKDGTLEGGHIVLAANKDIPDCSDEQFFGNGPRPADDSLWASAVFLLGGAPVDYYDFVRAEMAGGRLSFDPLREIADMVDSNCADLHYRVQAVDLAIEAGLDKQPEPERLPPNIYGTEGDWETYSTPSRDARLKTAFKEVRDQAARFLAMYRQHDPKLAYRGKNVAADMLAVYERQAGQCKLAYRRSNGSFVTLGYEEAHRRLFAMSFDPYQCAERRWGAASGAEFAPCADNTLKTAWYAAEQNLRNQIDRTYEARMDFSLAELKTPGPGKGVPVPPDIDVEAYLKAQPQTIAAAAPRP